MVANIGSDGLLGMEVLQSCLPHQLDLRTGQFWAPLSVSGVPSITLTEEYGVIVGHMLVDASSWTASVLMVNPNAVRRWCCPVLPVWVNWCQCRRFRWLPRIRA